MTALTRSDGGCSVDGGLTPPSPGTPVELLRNGEWSNGWVVADGSSSDNVRAAKLGNSMITVGNLRWGLDIRACQSSPFKAEPAEPAQTADLFDF